MQRILITSLLCFFLAVSWVLSPLAHDEASAEHVEGGGDSHKKNPHKHNEDPGLLSLDPMAIPILYKDDVVGYLQITMKLRAKVERDYELIGNYLPIIRDALFSDLYSTLYVLWIFHRQIEFDNLRARMQKIVDKLLGKGRVEMQIYHQQLQLFEDRY